MNHSPVDPEGSSSIARPRFVRLFMTLLLALGVIFALSDWGAIRGAMTGVSLSLLPLALMTTVISYLCISSSFARISRLLKVEMTISDLMRVGFISVVLNHVIATGGAAGYSVRYALMKEHGVSFARVIAVSILHFTFTSIAMIGALPIGLIYLISNAAVPSSVAQLLAGATTVVIMLSGMLITLMFSSAVRARILDLIERRAHHVVRRKVGPTLITFDRTITEAVKVLRDRPRELVWIMLLIVIDWAASAMTVWIAFRSLGVATSAGMVVSGYVIGTIAGVASLVPGGLGVQEGSMAGVFALLGVNFNQSVLAAIVYRAIYFLLPYLISLGVYQWLMRKRVPTPVLAEVRSRPPHTFS